MCMLITGSRMRSIEWLGWPLSTLNHLNFYMLHCLMHLRNWRSQRLQIWCKFECVSHSLQKTNCTWQGRGQVTWPITKFWGSNHITGTAEPKVDKLCTRVGYINSDNRMTTSRGFVSDSWATCYRVMLWCHHVSVHLSHKSVFNQDS